MRQPNRGGFLVAVDRALEGSYLHWSNEESAWIRSGKAVGSDTSDPINGIVFRNETGHVKKAATASLLDGECFYTQYPSRDNNNQLPDKVGIFEDLTQYCGFSFNRSNNLSGLISTVDDECLLDWLLYTNRLETTNIRGCSTFREKQLVVVGYFFELCYDLCLSPRYNVSRNPGFESILGVFDNSKTA